MARPKVLVVGGGIAGVGVAWALGDRAEVTLVEQERQLAYHTSGRSAALFIPSYGAPNLVRLSVAGSDFFESPPDGLVDQPLLSPRGAMFMATPDELPTLEAYLENAAPNSPGIRRIDMDEATRRCPALVPEQFAEAVWEPLAQDIDVASLHQGFVRGARRAGATIHTSAPLTALARSNGMWQATVGEQRVEVDLVINAAGAWGDVVGTMAGVAPLGLQPKRRTAFMVTAPEESADWPLVAGVSWTWYFKPDGPQLLCSPADTTPMDPHDARPEEIDIALAIERLNTLTTLGIRSVRSSWAGLRTFTPDADIAIGPDPDEPSFIWLVGQGGDGIQSSPGASRLAAALTLGESIPETITELGVTTSDVDPGRFRT